MKTEIISGPQQTTFAAGPVLYCPYYNADTRGQGSIDYYQHTPFTHNPFTLPALGCSGSPVLFDRQGRFFGFMNNHAIAGATFSFDGFAALAVAIPEGQQLFVASGGTSDEAWQAYNHAVLATLPGYAMIGTEAPRFWSDLEYCTWVEQGYLARQQRTATRTVTTHDVLDDAFVAAYIAKIEEFGYPKGKFTLDHGWGVGPRGTGFGTWREDLAKFPNFRKTVEFIRDKGFTPGLWLAFPRIHRESEAAQRYPELLGSVYCLETNKDQPVHHYLADCPALHGYCQEVLQRFYDLGFRKFKIDMSYNYKHEQYPVHRALYKVAKQIDPELEMEFHVPDIFAMQYGDVIRTNDIWCTPYLPWRELVAERYANCLRSAPGKILNLDHIGGNHHAFLTREVFLEHLAMYPAKTGYPVVSVLPHYFGKDCVEALGRYLWAYNRGPRRAVSQFGRA